MTLQEQIRAAFADNQYPGDSLLTVYDAAGREYDETFQLLRGRRWQDMPVADFLRGDTPMADLTAESFHYYLPALLLASIDEAIESEDFKSGLAASLRFHLSPEYARAEGKYGYDDTERYEKKISLLTEAQRTTIIRALQEYVARGWAEEDDIAAPIARLMGKPWKLRARKNVEIDAELLGELEQHLLGILDETRERLKESRPDIPEDIRDEVAREIAEGALKTLRNLAKGQSPLDNDTEHADPRSTA